MSAPSVVVLGPTASGKSDVAMATARLVTGSRIVACDAMQVYRRMDIGTAKPTALDRAEVPHVGLDFCEPSERCTVARYVSEVTRARSADPHARDIIVGGTGLYLTALVDGLDLPGEWPAVRAEVEAEPDTAALHSRLAALDPTAAARIEPGNRRRIVRALEVTLGSGRAFSAHGEGIGRYPDVPVVLIGLRRDRGELRARIERRVHAMLEAGLVEEVRALAAEPGGLSATASQALGYKEVVEHLEGRSTLEEATSAIIVRTQQFAVRQERWYRRDPRIRWVDAEGDPTEKVARLAAEALA